jgi:hypothetical protein
MSKTTDFSKVDKLVNKAVKAGMYNLGTDVKRRAIIRAPKDSGDLRASARVDIRSNGETVDISFNTPYAKRRHYENNLHPATRLYLTNALKSIKSIGNYFRKQF